MNSPEIICEPNCGNSPRKEFLRDLNIAYARSNSEFIIDHASEDIIWYMHGDKIIQGKNEFSEVIRKMVDYTVSKLIIESLITHGKQGSASGVMFMNAKAFSFCDVYHFASHKEHRVIEMHSYVLESNLQGY